MNEEQGRYFLQALNAKNIASKPDGTWLKASCPLARWLHKNHKDANPSFGITLSDHEPVTFNCFGCRGGTGFDLVQTLQLYVSQSPEIAGLYDFRKALDLLDNEDLTPYELPEYGSAAEAALQVRPWPAYYLQSFVKADAIPLAREYLYSAKDHFNQFGQRSRGYTPEELAPLDIRYDSSRAMVVFPYQDAFGRLAGMRGRSIVEREHYDYTWKDGATKVNNAALVWYNELALNLPGWVVVVEGQFDVARVAQRWPKVVGSLTAKPTMSKLKKLMHAEGTILIPDRDDAGQEAIERYQEYHQQRKQPFRILNLPEGVKDADDCHSDWLYDQISSLVF
jgi:hypothetical protein